MSRQLGVAILISLMVSNRSSAASFAVYNDEAVYACLWFYPKDAKDWIRPPTELTRRKRKEQVTLQDGLNHYLVVSDAFKNKDYLGWYDFNSLVDRSSANGQVPTIILSSLYKMETRTRIAEVKKYRYEVGTHEYKICKMVPEQRSVTYWEWDWHFQQWVLVTRYYTVCKPVWETKTLDYRVRVPYTEKVEQIYRVRVKRPVLKILIDGSFQTVEPIPVKDT